MQERVLKTRGGLSATPAEFQNPAIEADGPVLEKDQGGGEGYHRQNQPVALEEIEGVRDQALHHLELKKAVGEPALEHKETVRERQRYIVRANLPIDHPQRRPLGAGQRFQN